MNTANPNLKGYIFVIISSLLYGSMSVMAKIAYSTGLSPTNVLWMRYAFSFIALIIFLRIIRREKSLLLRPIIILQGILFVAGGVLFFYALKNMAAGLAIVIMFTYPLWVTLMAMAAYNEKLDLKLVLAMVCAMTGISMISLIGQDANFTFYGALLAFGSSITYSLYTLISQKTVAYGDTTVLINSFFLVGTVFIAMFFPGDVLALMYASPVQIGIGLFMAVFNTLLAVLFHLKGVELIGASRAGFAGTAEPVFVIVLAAAFLGENLSFWQLAGSILVLSSLLFIVFPSRIHE